MLPLIEKDPRKALENLPKVELPGMRAELLGKIALSLAEKEGTAGKPVLDKCLALLAELKQPGDRVNPRVMAASVNFELKDREAAWKVLELALADVSEVLKIDLRRPAGW